MKEVSIVGLDLAKRVFQVHAAGSDGMTAPDHTFKTIEELLA